MTLPKQSALAHSFIGASGMYRWSTCPGSIRESRRTGPRPSSVYADEGTAAHALLAHCLRQTLDPAGFLGWGIDISEWQNPKLIENANDEPGLFIVDDDMVAAIRVTQREVAVYLLLDPNAQIWIEHRVDLSLVHPGAFGTVDIGIWLPALRLLVIIDFKYGAGLIVDVKGNKQLRYYALGLLKNEKLPAEIVRIIVAQPRCEHPAGVVRFEDIDVLDFIDFEDALRTYAKATEDPNAPLNPGDHCKFCDAARDCPALDKWHNSLATFEPVGANGRTLGEMWAMIPAVKARIAAIEEYCYQEAIAGRPPYGSKLVMKKSRRRWNDPAEIETFLREMGVPDEQIYTKPKLRSPPQMEDVLGAKALAPYIVSESSGMALVAATDRRKAVTPYLAAPFTAITDQRKA